MNVLQQWNDAAAQYTADQESSEFAEVNKNVVMRRFNNLQGRSVLDLGCGYGWYTDYFRRIGAQAVGCDGAEKMIEIARSRYPETVFETADILSSLPYSDKRFDLVFCNQVLMDLGEIAPLMREIHRIIADNGIFYMSIVHPAFYDCRWGKDEAGFRRTKIMERYLTEYCFDNEFWGRTRHYHRTVSGYLNTITDAGFRLVHMEEPRSYDGVHKSAEFPLFLMAEFHRAPAQ